MWMTILVLVLQTHDKVQATIEQTVQRKANYIKS